MRPHPLTSAPLAGSPPSCVSGPWPSTAFPLSRNVPLPPGEDRIARGEVIPGLVPQNVRQVPMRSRVQTRLPWRESTPRHLGARGAPGDPCWDRRMGPLDGRDTLAQLPAEVSVAITTQTSRPPGLGAQPPQTCCRSAVRVPSLTRLCDTFVFDMRLGVRTFSLVPLCLSPCIIFNPGSLSWK